MCWRPGSSWLPPVRIDIRIVQIYPLPDGLVRELGRYDILLFAEECVATGGIGQQLQAALLTAGWHGRFIHRAVTTNKIDHADVSRLKVQLGLDAAALRKSWEDLYLKIRLDQYLCQNGLAQSRERAKALIMAGVGVCQRAEMRQGGRHDPGRCQGRGTRP